jgi:hypothetical protein
VNLVEKREKVDRRVGSVSAVKKTFYTDCGQITNSRAASEEVFVVVLSIFAGGSDWLDSYRVKFGGGFRNPVRASVGNM